MSARLEVVMMMSVFDGVDTRKCDNCESMMREDIRRKKRFLSGIARIMEEGVYPCPDFLVPFFQVIVLKMAIFYSNFKVIVCFLVIFVIIFIKIREGVKKKSTFFRKKS